MPKAFDKVWHKGLLHKLKKIGISGNLLNNVTDFLHQTEEKSCSKWAILFMVCN